MKYFNYCNSIFYIAYGLFGAFAPQSLAGALGWSLTQLGQHEMRAYCLSISAFGIIMFLATKKSTDQKTVLKSIIFITLSISMLSPKSIDSIQLQYLLKMVLRVY